MTAKLSTIHVYAILKCSMKRLVKFDCLVDKMK